eukprot:366517-Chlamydomonas_euryale.AAC.8
MTPATSGRSCCSTHSWQTADSSCAITQKRACCTTPRREHRWVGRGGRRGEVEERCLWDRWRAVSGSEARAEGCDSPRGVWQPARGVTARERCDSACGVWQPARGVATSASAPTGRACSPW